MSDETGKARTKKAPKGGIKPQSRSQRAGLQVRSFSSFSQNRSFLNSSETCFFFFFSP
jgi:hypothetical protein